MKLKNKYFPYPVISQNNNSNIDSSFSTEIAKRREGSFIFFDFKSTLKDCMLSELLKSKQVAFAYHIECPKTCFRKLYTTQENIYTISLKETEISGEVQVCEFVIAQSNIDSYTNPAFSQVYKGWEFDIEKGAILAIACPYKLTIERDRDELSNSSSIFCIVQDLSEQPSMSMTIDLREDKIIIKLPKKAYYQYCSLQKNQAMLPHLDSMVIIPALIYVFSELKKGLSEHENYNWLRGLKKACKRINFELTDENLSNCNIMEISQILLACPINDALEFCTTGDVLNED